VHMATMKPLLGIAAILLPLAASAAAQDQASPMRIVIAGDSTAKDYNAQQYPLSGWGSMLRCAVGPEVTIDDRAQAGRSTKSFMAEGRLDAIARTLKPGDTLLIQFGHNDANQAKPERYTPIPDYEANLKHFIAVARMAHAQPVLITPVTRRAFKGRPCRPELPHLFRRRQARRGRNQGAADRPCRAVRTLDRRAGPGRVEALLPPLRQG
jgi:lysophospholipase L1-like esterase